MKNLSFEQLPHIVSQLVEEVQSLKKMLLEKQNDQINRAVWFNLTQLCNYLPDKPAKATVYSWVSNNKIPHHKGEKKLRFLKSSIDIWLEGGRKKTIAEINTEVDNYLKPKNK